MLKTAALLTSLILFVSTLYAIDSNAGKGFKMGVPAPPVKVTNTLGDWIVYDIHLQFSEDVAIQEIEVQYHNETLAKISDTAMAMKGSKRDFKKSIWIPFPKRFNGGTFDHKIVITDLKTGEEILLIKGVKITSPVTIPQVIGFPLSAGTWVAANAPDMASLHTNALFSFDAPKYDTALRSVIYGNNPQRFAIDFVSLVNGQPFKNNGKKNEDWYCYGAPIKAAAPGKVIIVKNNIPDHKEVGKLDYELSVENAGGNVVYIDQGNGTVSFYAHFQCNSILVHEGDIVQKGQVLGKLGNSGSSTAPHLHFHLITDINNPVTSYAQSWFHEGIPYAFPSFTKLGQVSDDFADGVHNTTFVSTTSTSFNNVIPAQNDVILIP